MMKQKWNGVWQVLLAACCWGLISVFSRPVMNAGLSAIQTTFVRAICTLVLMGMYLGVTDRKGFYIHLKDLWMFLGTGLISIVFFNICYLMTLQRTTVATATILLYTAPCFVLLMSAVIFHEKITGQKIAALILAFFGCVLVSGFAAGEISMFALLTGIGSGIGYAAYSIFSVFALKKYRTYTVIFYTFVVATICLLPFVHAGEILAIAADNGNTLFNMIALGVVSTFLPYIFYTTGLKFMEAGKASVLAFAEPMVGTIAGIAIFHETLHMKNALGIVLIFAAIVLLNIPLKKIKKKGDL